MFSLATSVRIRGRNIGPAGAQRPPTPSSLTDADDVFRNRAAWDQGVITISNCSSSYGPFYSVLPPGCTQDFSFATTMGPMIDSFLESKMNCTVFAYGQTGSGKTHTLLGPPRFFDLPPSEWGLCPRTGREILERLQGHSAAAASSSQADSATGAESSWDLRCTAVELYFDDCYDLLNKKLRVAIAGFGKNTKKAAAGNTAAVVQRDKDGKWIPPFQQGANGAFNLVKTTTEEYAAQGTTERQIRTMDDFLDVMQIVESTRSAKSHALNDRSSRSHCVVTLTLVTKTTAGSATFKCLCNICGKVSQGSEAFTFAVC
eukprot:TRINITY_DN9462_c0_g1_i5.p1 TRINITY_DN9462_c0_g1~~TRINITY_DN9462_c0_g1_i5.p1  ORF type:complete len:316 (-),score=15.27 TRINITY_DN9462_c0_g1_i5:41-988(-)